MILEVVDELQDGIAVEGNGPIEFVVDLDAEQLIHLLVPPSL